MLASYVITSQSPVTLLPGPQERSVALQVRADALTFGQGLGYETQSRRLRRDSRRSRHPERDNKRSYDPVCQEADLSGRNLPATYWAVNMAEPPHATLACPSASREYASLAWQPMPETHRWLFHARRHARVKKGTAPSLLRTQMLW
jgi:hypothetical protein